MADDSGESLDQGAMSAARSPGATTCSATVIVALGTISPGGDTTVDAVGDGRVTSVVVDDAGVVVDAGGVEVVWSLAKNEPVAMR